MANWRTTATALPRTRHDTPANKKERANALSFLLAGETRFEHATYGFGDRCSINCAMPLSVWWKSSSMWLVYNNKSFRKLQGVLQIFLKKDFGAKFRGLRKNAQRVLWGQWGGAVRNKSTARSYSILPNGNPVASFELCTITDFYFLSTEVRNFRDPQFAII